MDPRDAPPQEDGPSASADSSPPPPRRRLSMDEDLFYQHIMTTSSSRRPSHPTSSSRRPSHPTSSSRRPSHTPPSNPPPSESPPSEPPPYDSEAPAGPSNGKGVAAPGNPGSAVVDEDDEDEDDEDEYEYEDGRPEELPDYSSSIYLEGVFAKKHEIEDTTKRAEDRHWHNVFVTLNSTALNVYHTKKDWGWGRSRDGPSISPDNPPWIRRAKLEKSYSLLYADAGIAADYKKRRYVIRVRAETDQFLLCCVELETFVKWLEALFAAIDISAPIDDRDFPRDMSIPRIQRVRWFRGQSPVRTIHPAPTPRQLDGQQPPGESSTSPPPQRRRSSSPLALPPLGQDPDMAAAVVAASQAEPVFEEDDAHTPGAEGDQHQEQEPETEQGDLAFPPPRIDPVHRLSTTSYPNAALDPYSGKWIPEHQWSSAHDLLYAKLCYSYLLFRSPRKSNYIISKGKQWFVDWTTGRMVRVLPPNYGEVDFFGPWQIIHTENRRI